MTIFLVHWLVVALGLAAAAYLVPGVTVSSGPALAFGALVLGFVNAVVRPVMTILTLPLTVVTLGLFYFVVNAAAFGLAAALVPGFTVASLRRPPREEAAVGRFLPCRAANSYPPIQTAPIGRGRGRGQNAAMSSRQDRRQP